MNNPHISVIIPTYNRPDRLRICLDHLKCQTAAADIFEVIVVNDGGSDITAVAEACASTIRIQHFSQPNAGPAAARNFGASKASGTFLAFLDDDCSPMNDWIESITRAADTGWLIGGKVINLLKENLYAEACQTLIDVLYLHLQDSSDLFFTSNNLVMAATDFQRIGGFDTSFRTSAGEDRELCVRAQRMGLKLIHTPNIRIGHSHDMDLGGFIRLHTKYGRAAHTYRAAIQRLSPSAKPAGSGFYRKLLMYPFRAGLRAPFTQATLLALSQLCTVYGYLIERYGSRS